MLMCTCSIYAQVHIDSRAHQIPVRIMPVPNIPTRGHAYATRHIRVLACAR